MPPIRDKHCSSCGTAFPEGSGYPKTCTGCGFMVWANPIPVSVVLVPVEKDGRIGLLVVSRAIEPGKGRLAIVGGFLEEHETWQQGGAREVLEETGVRVDPSTLEPFWYTSTEPRPNRVLLFSTAPTLSASSLDPFTPSPETSTRGLVFGPDDLETVFAFPLHVMAARKFFAARGITGHHEHTHV
jgi:ADP-ribose pyrophosphatase YjhB (NUDIX family)